MVAGKSFTEQREHKRFKVEDFALAVNSTRINPIVDISLSGLAFLYRISPIVDISSGGLAFLCFDSKSKPNESPLLDILFRENCVYLKDIPSKIISDFAVIEKSGFSLTIMKRCSLKFGELMPHQIVLLKNLILNYTSDEA